jgi:hypothetical protein
MFRRPFSRAGPFTSSGFELFFLVFGTPVPLYIKVSIGRCGAITKPLYAEIVFNRTNLLENDSSRDKVLA